MKKTKQRKNQIKRSRSRLGKCPSTIDGKHEFSPDYEKDNDGGVVSCEFCGLDKFEDEMEK